MIRRDYMASVATGASTSWASDNGRSLDEVDWGTIHNGDTLTGEFEFASGAMWAATQLGELNLETAHIDTHTVGVRYDSGGVRLGLDAEGDAGSAGAYGVLSPEDARELAVALYQAAVELEHIQSQEYDPREHSQ